MELHFTQVPANVTPRSYQSVDEVISLEFESLDCMKYVDLLVESHLLTDDPTCTEQPTLTCTINTVDKYRCPARGALC